MFARNSHLYELGLGTVLLRFLCDVLRRELNGAIAYLSYNFFSWSIIVNLHCKRSMLLDLFVTYMDDFGWIQCFKLYSYHWVRILVRSVCCAPLWIASSFHYIYEHVRVVYINNWRFQLVLSLKTCHRLLDHILFKNLTMIPYLFSITMHEHLKCII